METIKKHQVKVTEWPGKTFVVKRATIGFDKLTDFFTLAYGELYQAIAKSGMSSSGPPCAVYYSVDETRKETDLAAAVPVLEPFKEPEGFQSLTIPKSKALLLTYYGSYENMGSAYAMLEEFLAANNLQKEWMLEEYFSDPAVEKDPAKWKTNIYFTVK